MSRSGFFFKLVFSNIRRNFFIFLMAVLSIASIMTVILMLNLFKIGFANYIDYLKSKNFMFVIFEPDFSNIEQVKSDLKNEKISFKILEKAEVKKLLIDRLKLDKDKILLLSDDIIPTIIKFEDFSLIYRIDEILKKYKNFILKKVYNLEIVHKIRELKNNFLKIYLFLFTFLTLSVIVIIFALISFSIYNRKDEINIMQLVGATNYFIVMPFIVESIIYGAVSSVLAVFLFKFCTMYLGKLFSDWILFKHFIPLDIFNIVVISKILLVGVLSGIISSLLSILRYLT